MTIKLSQLAKNYPASKIRKMFELANQYKDVIKLTLGEPDFNTPENIKEVAKEFIDKNDTHYVSNAGIPELREAIAREYTKRHQIHVKPEEVMISFGAMEAIFLALTAKINPGDEILVSDPGYPNYIGQIEMLGGKVVPVPVYEESNFKLMKDEVEKKISPKTRGIIINSPSNPLGAVLNKGDLHELAELIKEYDLFVISDEVYDQILYSDEEYYSIAQVKEIRDKVLIVNSFSKTYAMTGWRIGYVIGNEKIISSMPIIQEGITACVPGFIQRAAIEAIEGSREDVEHMLENYRRRRDIVYNWINKIPGLSCNKTEGTFYAFVNIKSVNSSSESFALELLKEKKVAVTPGIAFGEGGEGYIRISFATSEENLKEAMDRIEDFVLAKQK